VDPADSVDLAGSGRADPVALVKDPTVLRRHQVADLHLS
jgi:hypothetical protein